MELGLSLGDAAASKSFGFMDKSTAQVTSNKTNLGFCMALSIIPNDHDHKDQKQRSNNDHKATKATATIVQEANKTASTLLTVADDGDGHPSSSTDHHPHNPVQLDLLPNTPVVPRSGSCENIGSSANMGRRFDENRLLIPVAHDQDHHQEGAAAAATPSASPPNSAASSFQMDFGIYSGKGGSGSNNEADQAERASSRASDEDENGSTRKKLRLSKDQSAFLEESFKEHSTLTPKQKLALAKQLNLRPRQVEVWFQNRRARTKLKQTEVDCEYLKRCCETLTEENRRLHKELQELRALKTSNPFYMQLPATTLTMCPSCERVASTTASTTTATTTTATTTTASAAAATIATITTTITNHNNRSNTDTTSKITTGLSLSSGNSSTMPRFYPFSDQTQSTNPNKSTA